MAPYLKKNKLRNIEYLFFAIVVVVFIIVSGKYFFAYAKNKPEFMKIRDSVANALLFFKKQKITCGKQQVKIKLSGGEICRDSVAQSQLTNIYDTLPLQPNGKEIIYSFLDSGNVTQANDLLNNIYDVPRSKPAKLYPLTWTEDPYSDADWKSYFYSLQPTDDLLYAYGQTRDPKYLDKLNEILNSFLDTGMPQKLPWADNGAVSLRTMVLINTWWKLRAQNALPVELSSKILQALEQHGNYLADANNYQPGFDQSMDEAAALYLLAVDFPQFPQSAAWQQLAQSRLVLSINNLVDGDGVAIENAAYNQFYSLEKYWQIYQYFLSQKQSIGDSYVNKLKQMMAYATYILQPDLNIPLLGSSVAKKVSDTGIYKDMADLDPNFKYVLTQGRQGTAPPSRNMLFPESGESILRSGWGSGSSFAGQTQLIFHVGPYRTAHSDLDALSFNLYSRGIALLPDAGLYTSDSGPYRDYFRGTISHNTVIVDGKNQSTGPVSEGQFAQGDGYSLQTAEDELYTDVKHQRAMVLIENKYILIIDNLTSGHEHSYEQLFHLFPEAKLQALGLSVTGLGANPDQAVTIDQLSAAGIKMSLAKGKTSPVNGFCSRNYGQLLPCYAVSYKQTGKDAKFVTMLTIGQINPKDTVSLNSGQVIVNTGGKQFTFNISQTDFVPSNIEVKNTTAPLPSGTPVVSLSDLTDSHIKLSDPSLFYENQNHVAVKTSADGSTAVFTATTTEQDLSNKNIYLKIKVNGIDKVNDFYVDFSNNNWSSYIESNLERSYRSEYDGEWIGVNLGKGMQADAIGDWQLHGQGFDWSKVDSIRIKFGSVKGYSSTLEVSAFSMINAQKQPEIAFVFDDGYSSIKPAAELMHKNNMPGNIAVIADRVNIGTRVSGYLTLDDLKHFQNDYGWNMVNHSEHHLDALQAYVQSDDLEGYRNDLLNGAETLIQNGLNSAPNWYIYPHGSTDDQIKSIVGQYYTFARTTQNQTEAYPFGEPLGVKNLSASGNDSEGSLEAISPQQIIEGINNAIKYNLTLLITFHRIHTYDTDKPGYSYNDFQTIIDYLAKNKIPVKTLSQIDTDFGIPQNTMSIIDVKPAQISLQAQVKNTSLLNKIFH